MVDVVKQVYEGLLGQQSAVASNCLEQSEFLDLFTRCHNFLGDIEKFKKIVGNRPESACVDAAINEYQFALSAVMIGQYRHAFGSLRLTIEMLIAAIYFSGHEVKLRQWLNSKRDVTWGGLTDNDKGVFAKSFIKAFHPFLDDLSAQYAALATAVYRECSEYVHGNPSKTKGLEGPLQFREDLLRSWEAAVQNVKLSLVYVFLYRYLDHIDEDAKGILEALSVDNLWHEEQVRAAFEEA